MDNPNIYHCQVWRVLDDKTIAEALIVKIIYIPETDTFNLLLDEDQMTEFLDLWANVTMNPREQWKTSSTD